ncbi:MAG: DUF2892 domain-containing protein [Candidatus Nanopelagicales bacterium]
MIRWMRFSIDRGDPNVGREDRFVRSGVALSLLLLGAFPLASRGVSLIGLLFLLVGGYFAGTAGWAWDPLYQRHGIDTRVHDARVLDLTADQVDDPSPADRTAGDLSSLRDR